MKKHLLYLGKFERNVYYKLKGYSSGSDKGCIFLQSLEIESMFLCKFGCLWVSLLTFQPGKEFIFLSILRLDCQDLSVGITEGSGTPLQYFCLENPIEGGAW